MTCLHSDLVPQHLLKGFVTASGYLRSSEDWVSLDLFQSIFEFPRNLELRCLTDEMVRMSQSLSYFHFRCFEWMSCDSQARCFRQACRAWCSRYCQHGSSVTRTLQYCHSKQVQDLYLSIRCSRLSCLISWKSLRCAGISRHLFVQADHICW